MACARATEIPGILAFEIEGVALAQTALASPSISTTHRPPGQPPPRPGGAPRKTEVQGFGLSLSPRRQGQQRATFAPFAWAA